MSKILPGQLGCQGYLDCIAACDPNMFDACSATCKTATKSASYTKYANALACGQSYCLGNKDAGTNKCGLNSSGTMLTEADGTPIKMGGVCETCLNNSLAGLFGDMCSPVNSPDCNPAMCVSLQTACHNDP
jgi:hypothetical protein